MSIEVMKQALDALEFEASGWEDVPPITREAITALRQAIEQTASPDLSKFTPANQQQMLEWLADGSFAQRAIDTMLSLSKEITALKKQLEQEPVISTDHGPWLPSTHPGEEGETYCKRCLLRDKFFGSRQCDPHFVYKDPPQRKPLTETEIRTLRRDLAGTLDVQYVTFARAIEAAHGIGEKE